MPEKSDLRKVFMVLGAGLATAFLITAFFVSNYGPNGNYALKDVLLQSSVLKQLNYNDWNPKISAEDRYVFDKIIFYANGNEKTLNLKSYGKIYDLLSADKSIDADHVVHLFTPLIQHLFIYVKTESDSSWQASIKMLQQVEFANEGNHYRVQLHEDNKGTNFVYFYHKNVLEHIHAILKNE